MTERLLQSFGVLLSGLFSAERLDAQKPARTELASSAPAQEERVQASSVNDGEHETDCRLH